MMKSPFRAALRGGVLFLAGCALVLTAGCGCSDERYFVYDSNADEISGKINLDNVRFITPRLRVGSDDMRLNEDNVDALLERLKDGDYETVRITAFIVFDGEEVTLYESELFEKAQNPISRKDLRGVARALHQAIEQYEDI